MASTTTNLITTSSGTASEYLINGSNVIQQPSDKSGEQSQKPTGTESSDEETASNDQQRGWKRMVARRLKDLVIEAKGAASETVMKYVKKQ